MARQFPLAFGQDTSGIDSRDARMTDTKTRLQDELARAEARLKDLERESAETRARIEVLRTQLCPPPSDGHYQITPPPRAAVREMTSADTLALFRQLFRGREDVFARLWVNPKKQTEGYAPACAEEFPEHIAIPRGCREELEALLRSPILLTERKDHLEFFAERLRGFVRHLIVLQGGMTDKERRTRGEQLDAVLEKEERLVLATGRYIGEGFDDARLDTLFLALPISWKGTLVQYTGRLHRPHPTKTEVRNYDYVDRGVPMLLKMFEKRQRAYRAIGYLQD